MIERNNAAAGFAASEAFPVMSVAPVTLLAPGRGENLQLRVSAPTTGNTLPIIIFSHGNGQSLHTYGPLVNHWAAHGFVVIQPTHLDSRLLGLAKDDPRRPQFWRFREQDLTRILDELDAIEQTVPAIKGRLDRSRIAVAGHSWGAQTTSMLLGATHPNPDDNSVVNIVDPRVKAGVLLTVPGTGGANLSPFAAQNFPFMQPDFSNMITPALVVAGDRDKGAMSVRGPDWWREAYDLSPGDKSLFTVFGGEHSLGGISNYEAKETTDESPKRVAAVQQLSTAYLRSALYRGDPAWDEAVSALRAESDPQGQVENK
jgi:pimeloyl-ACP methyl ester carboxylesterase